MFFFYADLCVFAVKVFLGRPITFVFRWRITEPEH
jgi:hypothetical protein